MSKGTFIGAGVGLIVGLALAVSGVGIGLSGVVFYIGLGAGIGSFLDPLKSPAPGKPNDDTEDHTTAKEGAVIPEVLGTQKVSGNILHWYGNGKIEEKSKSGGKGGGGGDKVVTKVTQKLSWVVALCTGPVDAILSIYANNICVWSGVCPRPNEEEIALGIYFHTILVGQDMIDETSNLSSIIGTVHVYYGIPEQPVPNIPDECWGDIGIPLRYKDLCYLHFDDCTISNIGVSPSTHVVLTKLPANFDICGHYIKRFEYNPVWAIYYILTSMIKFPEQYISLPSFRYAAQVCAMEEFGIGILMSQSTTCLVWIDTILRHINAALFWNTDAKLHITLLRAAESVDLLPVIDESMVLEPIEFDRPGWMTTLNQYKVMYPQRTNCPICEETMEKPVVKGMSFAAGQLGAGCGVWMWGTNERGEIGIGHDLMVQFSPRSVIGINELTGLPHNFVDYTNFGYMFPLCATTSIALRDDCTLWTWGSGGYGQLGDGTWRNSFTPTSVMYPNIADYFWKRAANGTGAWHMCAITQGGDSYCWGYNAFGGLGNGLFNLNHYEDKNTPVSVLGGHKFIALSVGLHQTLALKDGGEAWVWGGNQWGEAGINSPSINYILSPMKVSTTVRFLQIWASHSFSLGLDTSHKVWAWGSDSYGVCGQNRQDLNTHIEYLTPVKVITDLSFKSIVGGSGHAVALAFDGSVWVWGSNILGEAGQIENPAYPGVFGYGNYGPYRRHWFSTPTSVKDNHSFRYIGAGFYVSYGIKDDGSIWFWGRYYYGGVDYTGRPKPSEADVAPVGYGDGDQTGEFGSELPDQFTHEVIARPTETSWYRPLRTPVGYHRILNTDGGWHYHNSQFFSHSSVMYSNSMPEGCYWKITVTTTCTINIVAEINASMELRIYWDGRLAGGYDGSYSWDWEGYELTPDIFLGYDSKSVGGSGDTLSLSNTVGPGTYWALMYWKSGSNPYRIKCTIS